MAVSCGLMAVWTYFNILKSASPSFYIGFIHFRYGLGEGEYDFLILVVPP
jgi:hypothetical protein